jgi:hypothetical protein
VVSLQQVPPQQCRVPPTPQLVPSLAVVPVHVPPLVQALLVLHSTSQFWQ